MNATSIKKTISRCGRALFQRDISTIDQHDVLARQIQADLDAEHYRRSRSQRKVYYPPGTVAPRRLAEVENGGAA